MSEGALVILGTLSILGIVAIAAIALVYNRAVSIKAGAGDNKVELNTIDSSRASLATQSNKDSSTR